MTRAWVLLGVALAVMLTLLGVWWFADGPNLADPRGAPPATPTRAASPGTWRHGGIDQDPQLVVAQLPAGQSLVGGVFVSPEDGPLTLGAIELWCANGQLGARAQLDEDGSLLAPACSTTTCVRLRHPAYEQPIAWELAPDERREFEVAAAPRISGSVHSPLGPAVADASLVLRSDDGRRAHARTDAAGEFAVALPGLRPCDACDRGAGDARSGLCRATALDQAPLPARVLVSAPGFAPTEFQVELEPDAETVSTFVFDPSAAPITGVVRGADDELFDARTKVLATNVEREDEQHHAPVVDGRFALTGLAEARYRLRAVRDGRELAVLDSVGAGDEVELRAEQPARGVVLQLRILDGSGSPAPGVRVDGGPFAGGVTDAAGHLEASDVASGSHTLRLRAAGCSVVRAVVEVTPPPTPARRTLRLPASCDLSE
ncbi:hypothetical protein DB30_01515 [Enhygromyxa salina]|uniref:Uncharacterized protein n=1 Tax=Enhygromyxa salina TaxID=215803 RepID=A0A0C1ZMU5_9BACT|nr:carboxypeptidase-like regulatory domain-containing protein [Enhygromyxa salina]KIG12393.1 hypothetical protein DB30_01515 [Enhygromyxa salina]